MALTRSRVDRAARLLHSFSNCDSPETCTPTAEERAVAEAIVESYIGTQEVTQCRRCGHAVFDHSEIGEKRCTWSRCKCEGFNNEHA